MSLFREPDAGNLPVRFDEREQETGPRQTGLRWQGESQVEYPPGDYSHCACSRLYSPFHSSTFQRAIQAVPLLDQLSVLIVTDPDDIRVRLRVAPEYDWFDVPLDFALQTIIGAERCAS